MVKLPDPDQNRFPPLDAPAGRTDADGVIDSRRLFGHRHEVIIRHDGMIYRLRITRNGKLILNK